jgi:hypothetical protein
LIVARKNGLSPTADFLNICQMVSRVPRSRLGGARSGELHRLLAVRYLVVLFLRHLLEVEPDQRLVLGCDRAQRDVGLPA